jgi:hypothetical protein
VSSTPWKGQPASRTLSLRTPRWNGRSETDHARADAECAAHTADVFEVALPLAATVRARLVARVPVTHEDRGQVKVLCVRQLGPNEKRRDGDLLGEQPRSDGRVDTARHGDNDWRVDVLGRATAM